MRLYKFNLNSCVMKSHISNNIFLQKNKYNPDIDKKKDNALKERKENIFKKNTIVYNSITNQIPENINSNKDLELKKDEIIFNIEEVIENKKKERLELEKEFSQKNPKQKMLLSENINEVPISFNEMKQIQVDHVNIHNLKVESNKNKYENIMKNLKDLGIINNK